MEDFYLQIINESKPVRREPSIRCTVVFERERTNDVRVWVLTRTT